MSKKTYTPDKKGVTQWLKDNPTKKNSRGRTVRTGLRDAYKAVGYKGPPLKSKEGNLSTQRDRLRLSLRGDAGDADRSAAARPFTKEEFLERLKSISSNSTSKTDWKLEESRKHTVAPAYNKGA